MILMVAQEFLVHGLRAGRAPRANAYGRQRQGDLPSGAANPF